ncbi:MAG: patatin-like phospholipase family protein [Candidatus Doudnabacteria bacterium]|nr:patatin-like phospholipase family protein [Candidatus Doudnabacteria bacterium]
MDHPRKKIGLALSGAAARSAFYLGFLEVLQEQNIPIDIIGAQSGASVVASAYACGTMSLFKQELLALDWKRLRALLSPSEKGGLYSLEAAECFLREHITHGAQFHDLPVRLHFVAANLHTGRLVPLAMGDVAHAIRTTCSVPGLFDPVPWGNQLLVDGGLLSVLPARQVREAGADVVIGVSVRSTKHVFLPSHIKLRCAYNTLKRVVRQSAPVRGWYMLKHAVTPDGFSSHMDIGESEPRPGRMNWLQVLTRSLDIAIDVTQHESVAQDVVLCDYMIHEGEGKYGDSVNLSQTEQLYRAGRASALEHVPAIRKLIAE